MGLLSWLAASFLGFVLGRLVPIGRTARRRGEALAAVLGGVAAGIAATALDFGGWKEADPLAATFAGLVAFAAVAVRRMIARPDAVSRGGG